MSLFYSHIDVCLQDAISFLAERILNLHKSQVALKELVEATLQQAKTDTVTTSNQLDFLQFQHGKSSFSSESTDSGCVRVSIPTSSTTYVHPVNFPPTDYSSEESLPDIVGEPSRKAFTINRQLLARLIQFELKFGWELNYLQLKAETQFKR